MKNFKFIQFLALAAVIVFASSCRDEFTEEQAIELQSQASADAATLTNDLAIELEILRDSLRKAGGVVVYTVSVVDAGNAIFVQGGRAQGMKAVSGATVTTTQDGAVFSATTGADGLAVFNDMRVGNVAVNVAVTDFTDVNYIADITPRGNAGSSDSESGSTTDLANITRHSATQVPVFPTTGPNTGTINGVVTLETDLTNNTPEFPASVNAIATIVTTSEFIDKFVYTGGNASNENQAGRVLRMSYADASVSGPVDPADGSYSLTVPASAAGLQILVVTSDVVADQTRYYEDDAMQVTTVTSRTLYGPGVRWSGSNDDVYQDYQSYCEPTSISSVDEAFITFDLPAGATGDAFGSGATATANIGMSGTIEVINVTDAGKMYTQAPDVTITGDGINGAGTAVLGAEGAVTSVTVDNAGQGYSSANVSLDFGGTDAAIDITLLAEIATTPFDLFPGPVNTESISLSTSGDDYTAFPTPSFDNTGTGSGSGAAGTIFGSISDNSDVTAGGSGYVARYNSDDNSNASDGVDNERVSGPELVISAPDDAVTSGAVQAAGHALIEGPITSITLGADASDRSGSRYFMDDPSTPTLPVLTISPSKGATAAPVMSTTDGEVISLNILTGGNGYTFVPSVALSGNALAQVDDMGVEAVNLTDDGEQYRFADTPSATFSGPDAGGTTATGTVNLEGVVSSAWTNQAAGALTGFNSATPPVYTAAGGGATTDAVITGVVDGAGNLTGFTVTTPGAGYSSDPTFTLTGGTDPTDPLVANNLRAGFEVNSVTISVNGNNYTSSLDAAITISDPSQSVTDAGLLGVGAVPVTATGESLLQVQGVTMLDNGSGYDYTSGTNTVTFSGGGGTTQATGDMNIATSIESVTVTAGGSYRPGESTDPGVDNITVDVTHIYGNYFNGTNSQDEDGMYEVTGFVYNAIYDDNGAGYSTLPTIDVDATDGGSGATIDPMLSDNGAYMTIDAGGSGYVVEDADADGNTRNDLEVEVTFGSSTIGTLDFTDLDFVNGVLSLAVGSGGSGYTAAPWVRVSEDGGSTYRYEDVTATVTAGAVTAVTIVEVRTYNVYPLVDVQIFREAASASAVLTTSGVIAVEVDAAGSGYAVAPDVIFTGGGGLGAAATATIVDGRVESIAVTAAGSGYTSAPSVTLRVPNTPYAAMGRVYVNDKGVVTGWDLYEGTSISTESGWGYTTPPVVTVTGTGGIGSGATIVAEINGDGQVDNLIITNGGSGYIAENNDDENGFAVWPDGPSIHAEPGKTRIKDIYLGTGMRDDDDSPSCYVEDVDYEY